MPFTRRPVLALFRTPLAAAASCIAALWVCALAHAEREHTVTKGQNLSLIAVQYGVSVAALAAANGVTRDAPLKPGQVLIVPDHGVVFAAPGDSLASIARRHDVSTAALARQNHLDVHAALKVGQRLVLPNQESMREQQAAERRWGPAKRSGVVSFYRIATKEQCRTRLVDERGRTRRPALVTLAHLLRPRDGRKGKEPHPRLVRLLAQVSDHFGGRPIHVISGYRRPGGYTKRTSRHVAAQAIDFRIPGVPLTELRDYCAKLDHVGVGYYPRSQFVHLDVRRSPARWTDYSGPGEAPMLTPPGASGGGDEPAAEDDGQPPIDEEADPVTRK